MSYSESARGPQYDFIHSIVYNLTGDLVEVRQKPSEGQGRDIIYLTYRLDDNFLEKPNDSLPLTQQNISLLNKVLEKNSGKKLRVEVTNASPEVYLTMSIN